MHRHFIALAMKRIIDHDDYRDESFVYNVACTASRLSSGEYSNDFNNILTILDVNERDVNEFLLRAQSAVEENEPLVHQYGF